MKKNYIALFLVSFCIYFLGWVLVDYFELNQLKIQSQDAVPTMFVPVAILEHRTLFLDEYYTQMISRYPHPDDKDYKKELVPFYVKKVKDPNTAINHYLSAFPILPALLALPFYLPVIILNIPFSWEVLTILSHVSSAAIVALSGVVFYALLKRHFALSEKKQIIVVLTYLFGSVNFSLSSQALWQHGPLQLFILLCLLFIYERNTFLAGLFLGLSILTRPTAVFMAPFIFLLAVNQIILLSKSSGIGVRTFSKFLFFLLLGLLLPIVFFFWYTNFYYFGISNNGYASQLLVGWLSRFPEGFLGLWASPSKGILVYSPVFVFSLFGAFVALKRGIKDRFETNFEYLIFACIVLIHTLFLGRWKHWFGGWSFGYRMAADVVPFLSLLLVPFLTSNLFSKYKRLFLILLFVSIAIHAASLVFFDGVWHAAYDRGFVDTSWLWSIRDSEFAFNIRRLLVKFGYLTQACPTCLPN